MSASRPLSTFRVLKERMNEAASPTEVCVYNATANLALDIEFLDKKLDLILDLLTMQAGSCITSQVDDDAAEEEDAREWTS